MNRGPYLSIAEADALYKRISSGELSIAELARETGRDKSALYRLFNRRYGHVVGHAVGFTWAQSLFIPDDPATRGYIAGLVDGEGSIVLSKGGYWGVVIGMTDEPVIDWVASFGGWKSKPYQPSGNRKITWQWRASRRRDVIHLLESIRPYMIVKAARADECLDALSC